MIFCITLENMSPNAEDPKEQGAIHDEVYLAMTPLNNIMRLYGLFPIPMTSDLVKIESVVDNIKFRWVSKLLAFTLTTLTGILCCCIAESWDYAPRVPDPLESLILTFIVIILCLAAFVNLCTMVVQGPKWKSYFKQWQQVDRLLDISSDPALRSFVRISSLAYLIYLAAAVGTALFAAILKYGGPSEDDYTGDGFIVGLFCYSVFINGCQLLPEVLFICLTQALKIRLTLLKEKISKELENRAVASLSINGKTEMAEDLQKIRISYQCILEVMKTTNVFMGPVLCVCVMLTTAYLSATIFMVFFQTLDNLGFVSLKIVFSVCCMMRLTSICLFAEQIKNKIAELKRAIYLIPIVQLKLSQESVHELEFLVTFVKKGIVSFTASDFFAIDKELLNKMSGAILTYTLTILEFSEKH